MDNDVLSIEETNEQVEEKHKRNREKQLNDIRKIIGMPEGRRFIWRILSETGVFRSSFTGNSQTFFNEGRRDVGLFIFNDLMEAKPTAFAQMQREYMSITKKEQED